MSPFSFFSQLPNLDFSLELEEQSCLKKIKETQTSVIEDHILKTSDRGVDLAIRGDLCLVDSNVDSAKENGFHEKVLKVFLFSFFAKEKSNRIPFSQLQLKIYFQSIFSAFSPLFSVCILLARNEMKK